LRGSGQKGIFFRNKPGGGIQMARREVTMNEMVEIIFQWHQGAGFKQIHRSLGFHRKTIRKYVELAQQAGINRGDPFPEESDLAARLNGLTDAPMVRETPRQDILAPHEEWFKQLLKNNQMTAKQAWRLFREESGEAVSYCTIKRYLRNRFQFGAPRNTVRLEVMPGSQAQVDFGYAGLMIEPETGRIRKTWAFIMTLSFSRHRFVRFVFKQDIFNWIDCHIRAFEFFGGVPATIVLDNLKAGVVKADIYDPTINRAYGELERHYGFVADPAKVGQPRHKGKVERLVPVVRKSFLAGRSLSDIEEANTRGLQWCREVGLEVHGTTKRKPYEVFQREEAAHLKPLPWDRYECPLWKPCTVHPDHHIVFDSSYYSLPTRFIGQEVWVRGTQQLVQIFLREELIKTHIRATRPGTWVTDRLDYPPEKLAYLMPVPTYCRKKALEIGPQTDRFIKALLGDHTMRNLRKAQAVLRLAEKYGPQAMEAAAGRALHFGNLRVKSFKAILEKGLAHPTEPVLPSAPLSQLGLSFLRAPRYFSGEEVAS
jgi:transposase